MADHLGRGGVTWRFSGGCSNNRVMDDLSSTTTVGLVEDSDEDFTVFKRAFARVAPHTRLVRWTRAEAALESLRAAEASPDATPDMLLVDLNLPGMDGCELIRHLRADASMRTIPAFVLSGSARERDQERSHQAGATGFFTKPRTSADLQALVANAMSMATEPSTRLDA